MSKPYVPKPHLLRFKNRNLHTPAALRDFSGHSRAVDRAQLTLDQRIVDQALEEDPASAKGEWLAEPGRCGSISDVG